MKVRCNYTVTAMKTEASGTACLCNTEQVTWLPLDSNFQKIP